MRVILRKISIYSSILACLFVELFAIDGTFKIYWPGKNVRISKSSKLFLDTILPLQQSLLKHTPRSQYRENIAKLLCISCDWSNSDQMLGADIETFGNLFAAIKIRPKSYREAYNIAQAAHPALKKIVQEIAQKLQDAVRQLAIGTAVEDLKQVQEFLQNIIDSVPTKMYVLQMFSIVQDIIRHFDGVSLTEFDFMILSQCGIFMHFLELIR